MILIDCNDAALGGILYFVKNFLTIIWIVGPLLSIIGLVINLITLVKDPENKKAPKKIKNSVIALVILFLIPTIVNAVMYLLDDKFEISACWNNNAVKPDYNSKYIEINPGENKPVYSNPDAYEKGVAKKDNDESSYSDIYNDPVTSCGNLEYCNKFLTSMVNNSKRLSDAIAKYHPPVEYNYGDHKTTWAAAINEAEHGRLVATTCVVPTNWGLTDVMGKKTVVNSVGKGGFYGYKGKLTQYTKQYKFDCTMTVKTAIQKGMIQPGDVIGVKAHTFSIYSVNQKTGSAVIFDGAHRFTDKCAKQRCSPMFTYSARENASMKLCQILRWVK